tara:strand:+ start:16707 stop:17552 length:846 start_codon:yes stop_codon:yes gene_type:complete
MGENTKRLVGASIIPVMRDPIYDNIYFILGKERRFPSWTDSETWADFGGSVRFDPINNQGETAEHCAARETWEETMCLLRCSRPAGADDDFARTLTDLHETLLEHRYVMKTEVTQPDGASYTTWVIEVPWDSQIATRFSRVSKVMRAFAREPSSAYNQSQVVKLGFSHHPCIRRRSANVTTVNSCFLEKTSVGLFSTPALVRAIEHDNVLVRRHSRIETLRGTFAARLRLVLRHLGYSNALSRTSRHPTPVCKGISWAYYDTPSNASPGDTDKGKKESSSH